MSLRPLGTGAPMAGQPLLQNHTVRSGEGTGLEDNHCLWGGVVSRPSPTGSPERARGAWGDGRALQGRPMSGSGPQPARPPGKGVCARAPLAPPGARGRRAHGAQRAGAGAGAGVGGALPARAAPSSPPSAPAPARTPPLGTSFACRRGLASVRVRGATGPTRGEGRGRGGPAPDCAHARHGPAPRSGPRGPAHSLPGRTRARGEQRVALGPQGRSRPRPPSPRPRWPRAGSNPPTHDNQVEMLPSRTAPGRGPSETQVPRG